MKLKGNEIVDEVEGWKAETLEWLTVLLPQGLISDLDELSQGRNMALGELVVRLLREGVKNETRQRGRDKP